MSSVQPIRESQYGLKKKYENYIGGQWVAPTDGEPADIDERDPQHLRHDTRKAVEELYSKGILTYCLTLDANADAYVKRIFGANNYTIVDHVDRLPEKLPTLFASLTS